MGLPIRELNVTNTGDETGRIILTKWIPEKRDDGNYYWPPNTPLGYDMWIPNVLDLKEEEGTIPVEIIESKEETGLWIICVNDYFGNEQHLYANKKPIHKDEKDRFGDYKGFRDWIIENAIEEDWFEEALRETEEHYYNDIAEESSDEYEIKGKF